MTNPHPISGETPRNKAVVDYWLEHYAAYHCTLCGNRGVIDSRGVTTPAGYEVGRLNYCICPNGQAMRHHGAPQAMTQEAKVTPEQVELDAANRHLNWALEEHGTAVTELRRAANEVVRACERVLAARALLAAIDTKEDVRQ